MRGKTTMSNNHFGIGDTITIKGEGIIRIVNPKFSDQVVEIQIKWPIQQKIVSQQAAWALQWKKALTQLVAWAIPRKKLLLLLVSLPALAILVLNLLALTAQLNVEALIDSPNDVTLSCSYSYGRAAFKFERRHKEPNKPWSGYSEVNLTGKKGNDYVDENSFKPNTKYQYRISAKVWPFWILHRLVRSSLKSKTKVSPEVLTLPSKPADVAATSPSDNQVVLRWQQPNGAERFEIYRGENQPDLEPLEIDQEQIRQENGQYVYTGKGLTPNTRYRYALVAWNQSGKSERTNPISIITLPSPPTNLILENDEDGVRLSWSSSDSGNGLGFRVYGSPTNTDGEYTEIDDLPHNPQQDRQSFVHAIAQNIQWYRIVAYNGSGDSQPAILPPQPIVKSVLYRQYYERQEDNTQIIISGTGFVSAGLSVRIGNTDATVVSVNPISITVQTPQGEGIQDVFVETTHGRYTLPGGFTYAYGFVEIPPANVLPENAQEVRIIVDNVQYSLGQSLQLAPLTQRPLVISITNGQGYEFNPLEEAPLYYLGYDFERLYIRCIQLYPERHYRDNWTVQVYREPNKESITALYALPQCDPIILLLRRQSETITVNVYDKNENVDPKKPRDYLSHLTINEKRPSIKEDDWKK